MVVHDLKHPTESLINMIAGKRKQLKEASKHLKKILTLLTKMRAKVSKMRAGRKLAAVAVNEMLAFCASQSVEW